MENEIIPIIMAANDKYAPYLGVTIHSILKWISSKYDYRIYILETGISDYHKSKIKALKKKNVEIFFLNVQDMISAFDIPTVRHLSPEATYRLLVDMIFTEYEKVLYIDCDTVVLRDVAELYQEDITGYILGASLGRIEKGLETYLRDELNFPMAEYFNSGVILINIPLFRKEGIGLKALKMLEEKPYVSMDQDVLNILCQGNVKYLDGHWNVEWQHLTGIGGSVVIDEARRGTLEYINDPYIVHYTSHYKPWSHPEIQLADYFWEEAKQTSFYEEILFQNLAREENVFSQYLFPWKEIKVNSRIILYGYGNVGRAFYEQIKKTKYCEIIAICDKRASDISNMNTWIIKPEELSDFDQNYDAILLALEKKSMADSVRDELVSYGLNSDLIRWSNYIR